MYTWRLRQKKVEEKEEFFGGSLTMGYGVPYEGPPKFSSPFQPGHPPTEQIRVPGSCPVHRGREVGQNGHLVGMVGDKIGRGVEEKYFRIERSLARTWV
jgi:hypothetical protein